jgi:hypothetical protein
VTDATPAMTQPSITSQRGMAFIAYSAVGAPAYATAFSMLKDRRSSTFDFRGGGPGTHAERVAIAYQTVHTVGGVGLSPHLAVRRCPLAVSPRHNG